MDDIEQPPRLAAAMFAFYEAECSFDDAMVEAGFGQYTRIGGDDYDNSIEFYEVENDARMGEAAQRVVFDAGFSRAYLNHKDGWQTHYSWGQPFKLHRGWRRYMEHDAEPGPSGVTGFSIMKISYWPDGWTGSPLEKDMAAGKIVIVPDPLESR